MNGMEMELKSFPPLPGFKPRTSWVPVYDEDHKTMTPTPKELIIVELINLEPDLKNVPKF